MKAIEVLSLLNLYDALPRGLNVCFGDVFADSINRYPKDFVSMKGSLLPDVKYLEIRQQIVSALLWDRLNNCDAEMVFSFGSYRYLALE